MKHILYFAQAGLMILLMVGCTQQHSTVNTGSGPGSTTNPLPASCNPPLAHETYCPNYCQHFSCPPGSTTGGTTGGHNYNTTIPSDNNWGSLYPDGVPQVSCSSPTGTGHGLRLGTITMSGATWYSPDNAFSSVGEPEYTSVHYTHNISSHLVNVNQAKLFYDTDAKLRVRFMVRPQILPPAGKTWCFNRTPMSPDPNGYTALRFSVSVRGVNPDGTLKPALQGTQTLTVPINSCSAAVDFSGFNQSNPDGVVVVVHDVFKDSACWYKQGCTNNFVAAKAKDCWQMDVHVSVDGTRDI
jgi:hypothetical protein